jgi:hypothetical protein
MMLIYKKIYVHFNITSTLLQHCFNTILKLFWKFPEHYVRV